MHRKVYVNIAKSDRNEYGRKLKTYVIQERKANPFLDGPLRCIQNESLLKPQRDVTLLRPLLHTPARI